MAEAVQDFEQATSLMPLGALFDEPKALGSGSLGANAVLRLAGGHPDFAGQVSVDRVVAFALAFKSVQTLSLAQECLLDGAPVKVDLRRQMEQFLAHSLDGEFAEMAELAANVFLVRRLRSLSQLDETTRMDREALTNAECRFMPGMRSQKGPTSGKGTDMWRKCSCA